MYAPFEFEYKRVWDIINNIYNLTYLKSIDYLYKTNIKDFCHHFIKCYINKVLYFNTIIMSHSKDAYEILKRQLETLNSNLNGW